MSDEILDKLFWAGYQMHKMSLVQGNDKVDGIQEKAMQEAKTAISKLLSLELRKSYQKGYVKGKNSQMADNIYLMREMSELKTRTSLELEKQDVKSRTMELRRLQAYGINHAISTEIIEARINSLSQSPVESKK